MTRMILHTEASVGFGGQEVRILAEARWLLEHGWRALIAAQPDSRLLAEAVRSGIPAVGVPMPRPLSVRAAMRLRRLMRERAAHLVHTHSSVDSWLATVGAHSLHLPVVRSRHVSIPIRRVGALIYRLADCVITSGTTVKAMFEATGIPAGRVVAIPAGIDSARFHDGVSGQGVRAEFGIEGPLIGLVANIRGSKGHQYLLEAIPRVLAERDTPPSSAMAPARPRALIVTGCARRAGSVTALDVLVRSPLLEAAPVEALPSAPRWSARGRAIPEAGDGEPAWCPAGPRRVAGHLDITRRQGPPPRLCGAGHSRGSFTKACG
jgi:glycosyltransferase involved in cell wall biosynthesis